MLFRNLKNYTALLTLVVVALGSSAQAETIRAKDPGRIYDRGNHIWAQNFKIDKQTNTLSYEAGATAAECVPMGNQGAFLSIVLYGSDGRSLGTYDNVDIVNVENGQNVYRHKADLNRVDTDDLQDAVYFVPIMRGQAGC